MVTAMIWVLLFYQTFVLTAFHYVYRFVILCKPNWTWIQRNPWRNWLSIALFADFLYVGAILTDVVYGFIPRDGFRASFAPIMKEVYAIDLSASNEPGFLGIIYWEMIAETQLRMDILYFQSINENGLKEWNLHSVLAMSALTLVFSTSGLVIVYCLVRIIKDFGIDK
ncbi:hypothetical protein PFISCL1PPCAC_12957, partial [Pristionchus fissidentatus]